MSILTIILSSILIVAVVVIVIIKFKQKPEPCPPQKICLDCPPPDCPLPSVCPQCPTPPACPPQKICLDCPPPPACPPQKVCPPPPVCPDCPAPTTCPECPPNKCPACPLINTHVGEIPYTNRITIPVMMEPTNDLLISFKLFTTSESHIILRYDNISISTTFDKYIMISQKIRNENGGYSENTFRSISDIDNTDWSSINIKITNSEWILDVNGHIARRYIDTTGWPSVNSIRVGTDNKTGSINSLVINNKLITI